MTSVHIYVPSLGAVVEAPLTRVSHFPPRRAGEETAAQQRNVSSKVFVLCPATHTPCAAGRLCRFIHADVTGLPPTATHANLAWRCLEDVAFARHDFVPSAANPSVPLIAVAAPNSGDVIDHVPVDALLKTRALTSTSRPVHCAHYFFNRCCRLGANCYFVHAVYVDPCAGRLQLAPAPSQLSGRPHVLSLKQRVSDGGLPPNTPPGVVTPAKEQVAAGTTTAVSQPSRWRHNPYGLPTRHPIAAVAHS